MERLKVVLISIALFFSALALKFIIFVTFFFIELIAKPEEQGLNYPLFELVN